MRRALCGEVVGSLMEDVSDEIDLEEGQASPPNDSNSSEDTSATEDAEVAHPTTVSFVVKENLVGYLMIEFLFE